MRPVNLIPPEQRRGDQAPARAGAASYILIAVLFAGLFAVSGYVLVGNDVKSKEAELAALETERAEAEARASALANFADFQTMKDARVQTVTSLAQSRFDWERVMRELSLVIPETVWFTNVTGTVAPEVTVPKAASVSLRASVPGPALSLIGCARTQQDVAALISAVGDIDGVTRVLVERSEKPTNDITASGADEANEDCRTRNFIAKFSLVAAFDSVVAGASMPTSAAPAAPIPADGSVPEGTTPEGTQAEANIEAGTQNAEDAAGLIGAGEGG
jgi:Tfp pilus assembly protein PilN